MFCPVETRATKRLGLRMSQCGNSIGRESLGIKFCSRAVVVFASSDRRLPSFDAIVFVCCLLLSCFTHSLLSSDSNGFDNSGEATILLLFLYGELWSFFGRIAPQQLSGSTTFSTAGSRFKSCSCQGTIGQKSPPGPCIFLEVPNRDSVSAFCKFHYYCSFCNYSLVVWIQNPWVFLSLNISVKYKRKHTVLRLFDQLKHLNSTSAVCVQYVW